MKSNINENTNIQGITFKGTVSVISSDIPFTTVPFELIKDVRHILNNLLKHLVCQLLYSETLNNEYIGRIYQMSS